MTDIPAGVARMKPDPCPFDCKRKQFQFEGEIEPAPVFSAMDGAGSIGWVSAGTRRIPARQTSQQRGIGISHDAGLIDDEQSAGSS